MSVVFTVSALTVAFIHYLQVQWLKLRDWKAGNCVFVLRLGIQVSKKQNVFFPLTRKDLILCGSSVTKK